MRPAGHRYAIAAGVAALIVLAALAAVLFRTDAQDEAQDEAQEPAARTVPARDAADAPSEKDVRQTSPLTMEFTREGVAGSIVQAVERVVRPGRARVAVRPLGDARTPRRARLVCILVDSPERYCELDAGLDARDLPVLREEGFRPPPAPVTRTTSIYRSVAKRAMGYRADRGDRIIILLCPREDWPGLRLTWPEASARPGTR